MGVFGAAVEPRFYGRLFAARKRSVRAFGIGWGSQKAKAGFLRGENFFRFSLYGLQREDNIGNGVKELQIHILVRIIPFNHPHSCFNLFFERRGGACIQESGN